MICAPSHSPSYCSGSETPSNKQKRSNRGRAHAPAIVFLRALSTSGSFPRRRSALLSASVKPWFGGKLDFVPPVRDLTDQGFSLMGGRLEYLNRRPVAALVFRHSQHTINLFVWPASRPDTSIHTSTIQGYSLVHCSRLGVTYWAISDLNSGALRELVKYQQQ